MKTVCSFLVKFASLISWVLSCFDRVIFKGHLPISRATEFERFVDYTLKIRRADFLKDRGPEWSERLVEHSKRFAQKYGRPWEYHAGDIDKDAWAKEQLVLLAGSARAGRRLVRDGSLSERSSWLRQGSARLRVAEGAAARLVLLLHRPGPGPDARPPADLGAVHLSGVCQWPRLRGAATEARKASPSSRSITPSCSWAIPRQPSAAPTVSPSCPGRKSWNGTPGKSIRCCTQELKGLSHYWVIDQAEYATDLCFASKHALAGLFVRLLEFALLTFSPKKIFCYLGRKWHERFDGEVQTHYKSVREPGACIKHFMKRNWLKMYDKLGLLLRVETVINQPGEFKVLRECQHRDGTTSLGWFPMCKGVGNMHHYQSHALACNQRYLEALAAVDDPTPGYDDLKKLTEPQRHQGRSYAGFNPAREDEARLFAAVLAGDHIAQGFRNKDIRAALYDRVRRPSATAAPQCRRRPPPETLASPRLGGQSAAHADVGVSRDQGRRVLGDTLQTYRRYQTQAA